MKTLERLEMLKKKREMSPVEKDAKSSILEDIIKMASKAMGDNLGRLKKVTVASDSPEGLKEGLEKAEEIVEAPEEMESEDSMEESEDELSEESEELSEEELDAKIQELLKKKQALESKKQM